MPSVSERAATAAYITCCVHNVLAAHIGDTPAGSTWLPVRCLAAPSSRASTRSVFCSVLCLPHGAMVCYSCVRAHIPMSGGDPMLIYVYVRIYYLYMCMLYYCQCMWVLLSYCIRISYDMARRERQPLLYTSIFVPIVYELMQCSSCVVSSESRAPWIRRRSRSDGGSLHNFVAAAGPPRPDPAFKFPPRPPQRRRSARSGRRQLCMPGAGRRYRCAT